MPTMLIFIKDVRSNSTCHTVSPEVEVPYMLQYEWLNRLAARRSSENVNEPNAYRVVFALEVFCYRKMIEEVAYELVY